MTNNQINSNQESNDNQLSENQIELNKEANDNQLSDEQLEGVAGGAVMENASGGFILGGISNISSIQEKIAEMFK